MRKYLLFMVSLLLIVPLGVKAETCNVLKEIVKNSYDYQVTDDFKLTGINNVNLEENEIEYTPMENNVEYEFKMSESNVVESSIQQIITVPDTEKNKDYTLYYVLGGLALVLGMVYIVLKKKKK